MKSVSHAWDPSCPFCSGPDDLRKAITDRNDRIRASAPKTGKIPGTERQILPPIKEEEKLPPWVNVKAQPSHLQKLLTKPSKTAPQ